MERATPAEREQYLKMRATLKQNISQDKIQQEQINRLETKIEHLQAVNKVISRNVKKIFTIWDRFFKTLGTLISIGVATAVTYVTRDLYYHNGKWDFSVIFFGGLIYLIVVAGGVWLTWYLVDKLLIKKIECLPRVRYDEQEE